MVDGLRVNALLPDRLDSMADRVRDRLCRDERVNGMKLAWDFVADRLHDALKSALDGKLVDVLAECWAQLTPVAQLSADRPAGQPFTIQLGEHQLTRELKPVIGVTIGSCPCVELRFLLEISAHVTGVRLSIVDGHLVGGDLGEAWASAKLSYEGVPLDVDSKSRKLPIGEGFEFSRPGIAIPGLARS